MGSRTWSIKVLPVSSFAPGNRFPFARLLNMANVTIPRRRQRIVRGKSQARSSILFTKDGGIRNISRPKRSQSFHQSSPCTTSDSNIVRGPKAGWQDCASVMSATVHLRQMIQHCLGRWLQNIKDDEPSMKRPDQAFCSCIRIAAAPDLGRFGNFL